MFHHSKRINTMFLALALITFVILTLIGILLFKLSHKSDVLQKQDSEVSVDLESDGAQIKTDIELHAEQAQIVETYNTDIRALYNSIDSSVESIDMLLSRIEDGLLAVRVPKSMQEVHLEAVLSVARLRAQHISNPEEIQNNLRALLLGLLGK